VAARERRLLLDPDQAAHERRIDEAIVDVEIAWEQRAAAEEAVRTAEASAARAVERLAEERVSTAEVATLTGIDHTVLRRLRRQQSGDAAPDKAVDGSAATADESTGQPGGQAADGAAHDADGAMIGRVG